jgi:hypothetical protein
VKTKEGKRLIVTANYDYKLRAYEYNSNGSTPFWTSDVNYGSTAGDFAVNVGFVDFNGDGNPEVYVRDKIYNASTGVLLATATGGNNKGLAPAHWSHSPGWQLSSPVAADVTGDAKPELILGNEIYEVNITNLTGTVGNSASMIKTVTPPAGVVNDGHTQVADFNNDGHPDVFISNRTAITASATVHAYVWDVHNNTLSVPIAITTDFTGKNIPLIADINNDGVLDILIQCSANDSYKYKCYEYDPDTRTFGYLWGYAPNEDSYSNGATLFDFNQDGMNEIVLSEQNRICILNGSGKSHITKNDTLAVYMMAEILFTEMTIMQYPIIADVDADESAEIIAVGNVTGMGIGSATDGSVNVFKSSKSPWASARKVWNQYMYHAVNINEDLTVPTVQFNPAIVFPGKDHILGTSDDVRPYNNFLQQQTMLDKYGDRKSTRLNSSHPL